MPIFFIYFFFELDLLTVWIVILNLRLGCASGTLRVLLLRHSGRRNQGDKEDLQTD